MGDVWHMEKRNTHRVLVGKFEGKEHVEDIRKDKTMILKSFFEKIVLGGVNWINLAHVGEKSELVVKRVMNLCMFHKIRRIS